MLVSLGTFVGCGSNEVGSGEQIGTDTAAMGYVPRIKDFGRMWARVNERYRIPVCFNQGCLTSASPDWSGDKSVAFSALTSTWGAAAPIDFVNQGDCSFPVANDVIPVTLVYDASDPNAWAGITITGQGSRWPQCWDGGSLGVGPNCTGCSLPCQIRVQYGSNRVLLPDDFAHEVGHALGLMDGNLRADFPSPGSCNGQSWEKVTPYLDATYITAKPDFASIMSDRRASCFKEFFANYGLSDGDRLAISILYPWAINATTGSIGSTQGMYTTGGVVVRDDGSFTTAWYARGADGGLFNFGPFWRKLVGSSSVSLPFGLETSATGLSAGSNTAKWTFTDDFGRTLTGTTTVIKSSALHTALVRSAASVLL